jgi:hypothetical protein
MLNNAICMSDLNINGVLRCSNQVFNGNLIYNGAITCYSSLNVSGTTTVNNNLEFNNNGLIACSYLGVGSNYDSSCISMFAKGDM